MRRLLARGSLLAAVVALTLPPTAAEAEGSRSGAAALFGSGPVQELHVIDAVGIPAQSLLQAEVAMQLEAHALRQSWGTPEITFGNTGWPVVIAPPPSASELSFHNASPAAYIWTNGTTGTVSDGGTLPWQTIFSHEIVEMLVDPSSAATWNGGFPLEVCDPVLRVSVNVVGVPLQDFVTPRWFGSKSGPWDLAGVLTRPYDARR